MSQFRIALIGAVIAVAVTVGAVSASIDATPAKTVRIAIPGYENNITPYGITFRSGRTIDLINLVYDTLFYSPWQEDPEPWLAESATVSKDKKTWTIKIRKGIKWSDGQPLTAEDVRFTYYYFFKTEQGLFSHHVNDLPYVYRFRVIKPDTVRFVCREACPTFDIDPGAHIPIIPKHIWASITQPNTFTKELPVGTGPYRLVENVRDQFYRFESNKTYFKGRPLVDEIVMPIIPDSSAMFLALRAGQVDTVTRVVPPEIIDDLRKAGLKVSLIRDFGSVQINFNTQRPPLNRQRLRRAMNLGVNTAQITQTLLQDRGKPGVESFLDPDSPYADKSLKHVYDPVAAGKLLDQLGYQDRNSDGIREDDSGKALEFEVLVSSIEAREVRATELVADQLKQIGVKIRVTPLDPVTLNARRQPPNAGKVRVPETTKTGNYDMYVTSYLGGHTHFDPDGLLYFLHCPGKTGFGAYITGYCNKTFDSLVEQAAGLPSSERKPFLIRAQKVLFQDPPFISLYFPDGTYAHRPAAYSGWIPTTGHGLLHKRSFLPR